MVWGIMLKFIKFDDDEDGENLSATDALLKWLQFHLKDYPQVGCGQCGSDIHILLGLAISYWLFLR